MAGHTSIKNYKYRNISGATAVDITVDLSYFTPTFDHICLCNIHSTDSCTVDLYSTYSLYPNNYDEWKSKGYRVIADASGPGVTNDYTEPEITTETYYYMKSVTIPVGVTLQLSNQDFYVDTATTIYVKLGAGTSTVDLSIKGPIPGYADRQTQYNSDYSYEDSSNVKYPTL